MNSPEGGSAWGSPPPGPDEPSEGSSLPAIPPPASGLPAVPETSWPAVPPPVPGPPAIPGGAVAPTGSIASTGPVAPTQVPGAWGSQVPPPGSIPPGSTPPFGRPSPEPEARRRRRPGRSVIVVLLVIALAVSGGFIAVRLMGDSAESLSVAAYTDRVCSIIADYKQRPEITMLMLTEEDIAAAVAERVASGATVEAAGEEYALEVHSSIDKFLRELIAEVRSHNDAFVPAGTDGDAFRSEVGKNLNEAEGILDELQGEIRERGAAQTMMQFASLFNTATVNGQLGALLGDFEVSEQIRTEVVSRPDCML